MISLLKMGIISCIQSCYMWKHFLKQTYVHALQNYLVKFKGIFKIWHAAKCGLVTNTSNTKDFNLRWSCVWLSWVDPLVLLLPKLYISILSVSNASRALSLISKFLLKVKKRIFRKCEWHINICQNGRFFYEMLNKVNSWIHMSNEINSIMNITIWIFLH